jgi:hypothetical protein
MRGVCFTVILSHFGPLLKRGGVVQLHCRQFLMAFPGVGGLGVKKIIILWRLRLLIGFQRSPLMSYELSTVKV